MVNEVMKFIENYDPEVGKAIEQEAARQRRNLELIASENIVSEPVMMAMGTVLTNKYAEGYSGKRYYGGCQYVDVVETIAIERAKKLFGCEYANVQPHSGAQANMAVFLAMLKPGDPCRCKRIRKRNRLQEVPRDRRQGWRIFNGRYGAYRRSGSSG